MSNYLRHSTRQRKSNSSGSPPDCHPVETLTTTDPKEAGNG